MNFDQCFELSVKAEGRFQKNPKDRGNWTGGQIGVGELKGTKFGISAAAYPHLDIEALTREAVRPLYRTDYWDKLNADALPEWLRYPLFDYAVNSGWVRAARDLQAAVGVLRDGNIGPRTLAAVQKARARDVLRQLFVDRCMTFALDPAD